MATAECLDGGVCWVREFMCIPRNARGIHHLLLVLRIGTFILQALFFLLSHNLLDTFIFSNTLFGMC